MSLLPDKSEDGNNKILIELCGPLSIEAHPISTFNALSNVFSYKQEILPYLKGTKQIIESARTKREQINAVAELCNVISQVMRGVPKPEPVVTFLQDLSSYNIEALIGFASNLLNDLNNAVKMKTLNEKLTSFENIIFLFRSLLIRLRGTPLHDEIERVFNINEDNLVSQILADNYSSLIQNMIEKIGGALALMITHFK